VPCFYFEAVHYFSCFVATKNALTKTQHRRFRKWK